MKTQYGENRKIKREVAGVTEGLAIWDETTLREKKSVGKESLESVLPCSNHIYPPVFPAKICVCGTAEPPYTPPTVQVMAQYAGAHGPVTQKPYHAVSPAEEACETVRRDSGEPFKKQRQPLTGML